MAIELNRLMNMVTGMNITMIAGKKGLSNLVSWIHMVETVEASTFLSGGEIAFTTGIGTDEHRTVLGLVRSIWEHNAAGIIINTGPYLDHVPDDVIAFGNEHDFPVFTVPWKIHIAEIMRIFCFAITKSEQTSMEIAAAFKNAIFLPKQEELYTLTLTRYGYQTSWCYNACVMKFQPDPAGGISPEQLEALAAQLENSMQHRKYRDFSIFIYDRELLTICGNYEEETLREFTAELLRYTKMFLPKTVRIFPGVGKSTKSVRCIYKSYQQAASICRLRENQILDDHQLFYSDLGIYKLLMSVDDKDVLKEYYDKTILPLKEYDDANGSDLTKILKSYLKHNGSVMETASELYIHRNTVNYKLNRIEELLHMDLSSLDIRSQLWIGCLLQDMI